MDPTIATILGAILGALLAGPITYFFTKNLISIQEFNKAASIFRSSFVDEQTMLEARTMDVFQILNRDALIKHKKAKIIFSPHLTGGKLECFNNDWKKYEDYYQMKTQKVAPGSVDTRKKETIKALEIIGKLIANAMPSKN